MTEPREIFVTAYPRSGNTWLNRLLADVLNSPMQTQPGVQEWSGEGRGGDYVLRKVHLLGHEKRERGKWVFIQRDPRDVAVSAMYYSKSPSLLHTLLSFLCRCEPGKPGTFRPMCVYERWVRSWLDHPGLADVSTRYELLHENGGSEVSRIVYELTGEHSPPAWIEECVKRQSFQQVKKQQPHSHALRKGIVGDWHNHFTQAEGHLLNDYIGLLMYEQGYIKDFHWWQGLPLVRGYGR